MVVHLTDRFARRLGKPARDQGMDKTGAAIWNVACSNKSSYVIMVYNDAQGSTKILDCAVLKAVGGGECFKKL